MKEDGVSIEKNPELRKVQDEDIERMKELVSRSSAWLTCLDAVIKKSACQARYAIAFSIGTLILVWIILHV